LYPIVGGEIFQGDKRKTSQKISGLLFLSKSSLTKDGNTRPVAIAIRIMVAGTVIGVSCPA
jgi:hypothetical protein